MQHNFALPLWSLVDQRKVELGKSDMRGLAKELGRWLNHNFDIDHKGTAIEEPTDPTESGEPMLIVAKALGMPSDVLQRILLLVNPAIGTSVRRVFDLSDLYENLAPQHI